MCGINFYSIIYTYIVGLQHIMCLQVRTPKFAPALKFVVQQSQLLEEKRPFFKIQVGLNTFFIIIYFVHKYWSTEVTS
jgi:hypothetical protein